MKKSLFVLALLGAAVPAHAAAPAWTIHLDRFFASPEDEVAARADIVMLAEALERQSAVIDGAKDLLAAIETQDRLRRVFRQHDLFLFLSYALDTTHENAIADADALRSRVRAAEHALADAIAARGAAQLAQDRATLPGLARYGYWLDTLTETAARRPAKEAQNAENLFASVAGARDYPRVAGSLTSGGSDEASKMASLGKERRLLAHLLGDAIGSADAEAKLRGYKSAADRAATEGKVELAEYRALLAAVAAKGTAFKARYAATADLFDSPLRWNAAESAKAIIGSARAFDPTYGAEFAALLDPANGRADLGLAGGTNRLPLYGAGSVYPIGTSTIYMQHYEGALLDLVALAHESGHAVQAQLMYKAKVPMTYATGPGYFTESFARFQELLTLDYQRTHAPAAQRAVFRDALLARLQAVFPSAEEAAIEIAIHDLYSEKGTLDPDALDALTAEVGGRYSPRYAEIPARKGVWMLSEGYYMAPMQEFNDAYAAFLAVRYWQAWRADPVAFRKGYLTLLREGYDAPPADLLRRKLGIDMGANDFVPTTLAALESEVERFRH